MDEQEALDSQNQDLNRTSLVLRVRPGCETAYETLQAGLLEETRRFPGFKGEEVMRPRDPDRPEKRNGQESRLLRNLRMRPKT